MGSHACIVCNQPAFCTAAELRACILRKTGSPPSQHMHSRRAHKHFRHGSPRNQTMMRKRGKECPLHEGQVCLHKHLEIMYSFKRDSHTSLIGRPCGDEVPAAQLPGDSPQHPARKRPDHKSLDPKLLLHTSEPQLMDTQSDTPSSHCTLHAHCTRFQYGRRKGNMNAWATKRPQWQRMVHTSLPVRFMLLCYYLRSSLEAVDTAALQ